ncbi:hypothetical protein LOTGIDRAFT_162203 [Lottia gigantea]|uniref:Uncharacterized protein n=1 Tax=Lottia gigantea TaxID=225164 RepID=V4BUH6_LOTGI|nr:hypothetical protein LOTGIDRAFT_162203 [Lottia gigantea]ESO92729.1 hypothetical protein LOTGIDRAFT_162203 [Lottia gigantea]
MSVVYLVLTIASLYPNEAAEWTTWTTWSPCSVSCGDGVIDRARTLIPGPGEPQSDNPITMTDKYSCYSGICPVDGKWTRWGSWSECSKACGGGERKRFRSCNNPKPTASGEKCKGLNWEKEDCNKVDCPPTPTNFDMSICNESYFECDSATMCIPIDEQCNELVQCDDGSDEVKCDEVLRVREGGVRYSTADGNGSGKTEILSVVLGFVFLLTLMLILH